MYITYLNISKLIPHLITFKQINSFRICTFCDHSIYLSHVSEYSFGICTFCDHSIYLSYISEYIFDKRFIVNIYIFIKLKSSVLRNNAKKDEDEKINNA